jgi:hypothetical protein
LVTLAIKAVIEQQEAEETAAALAVEAAKAEVCIILPKTLLRVVTVLLVMTSYTLIGMLLLLPSMQYCALKFHRWEFVVEMTDVVSV